MGKIIIENVRGQWIVDKGTTEAFQEKGFCYSDGALIELDIIDCKSLCCHPNSPVVCTHKKE